MTGPADGSLPPAGRVLAVVAHPDDETFGLGALLATYAEAGAAVAVLCLTRGEASALGSDLGDLATRRTHEFHAAAEMLGVARSWLRAYPDGGLAGQPLTDLDDEIRRVVDHWQPDVLVTFHPQGITGHPDHIRATAAAECVGAAAGLPVWAWYVPADVATTLNAELGSPFALVEPAPGDRRVPVCRTRQCAAFAHHQSQQGDVATVRRMITLLGDTEHLRPLTTAAHRNRPHQTDPAATDTVHRPDPRLSTPAEPGSDARP